jgi:3-hydroxybutyryl-CoA dehydrogenase
MTGTMGNGIAHTFAQSGFTKLIDVSEKSLNGNKLPPI